MCKGCGQKKRHKAKGLCYECYHAQFSKSLNARR